VVLALVGALVAVLGVLVAEADKQVFDQTTVRHTVDRILADSDVTRLLSREITKRAVSLAALDAERSLVQSYVDSQLATPEVRKEIRTGVLDAYGSLMNGTSPRIEFNLPKQGTKVRHQLVALDPGLNATLPVSEDLLRFTLFRRASLPIAYDLVKRTRTAEWAMFVVGLALILISLALGPGRFGLFAFVSFISSLSMLGVWLLFTTGANHVLDGISDPLTRHVARLSTDLFLHDVTRLALAVVIFGAVAVVAAFLAKWIRDSFFPPKPKVRAVRDVPQIQPPMWR
jgi:hypothetical protein